MTRTFDAIIFDADDTLFDYSAGEEHALSSTFTDFSITYCQTYRGKYREINKRIFDLFEREKITSEELRTVRFKQLFETIGASPPHLESFAARYLERLAESDYLLDGAREVVEELSTTYKMAIVTNGLSDVQNSRFKRSGLLEHFSGVVISDEVGYAKPHPKIFELGLEKLGNPPREKVLFVGDNPHADIGGAIGAGLKACWLKTPERELPESIVPQYIIEDIREVVKIL